MKYIFRLLLRPDPEVLKDQPEHLQASGVGGSQDDGQAELHQGDRILRVLQTETSQAIPGLKSQQDALKTVMAVLLSWKVINR